MSDQHRVEPSPIYDNGRQLDLEAAVVVAGWTRRAYLAGTGAPHRADGVTQP